MPIEVFVYDQRIVTIEETETLTFEDVLKSIRAHLDEIYSILKQHVLTKDLFSTGNLTPYSDGDFIKEYRGACLLNQSTYIESNKIALLLVGTNDKDIFSLEKIRETGNKIRIVPTIPNKDRKYKLLLPLTLTFGSLKVELHEITTHATGKQLYEFIANHPKISQEIIQKSKLIQKLLNSDTREEGQKKQRDAIEFEVLSSYGNILKANESIEYHEVPIIPKLRDAPRKLVKHLHTYWRDAQDTTLQEVCQVYLGDSFNEQLQFFTLSTVDNKVETFCKYFTVASSTIKDRETFFAVTTAVVYYCLDTNQIKLLKQYPAVLESSLVPIDFNTLYEHALPPPTCSTTQTDSVISIHSEILKAHSSQVKTYDKQIKSMSEKLNQIELHDKSKRDRNFITNYLVANLLRMPPIPEVDYNDHVAKARGRATQAISNALELAKGLPHSLRLSQYRGGLFAQALHKKVKEACDLLLPAALITIINGYVGGQYKGYLYAFFAIPPAIKAKLIKKYKEIDFDNQSITRSCGTILNELGVKASGIMVGPDKLEDINKWSLSDGLCQIEFPKSANFIYFALPVAGGNVAGHAIAVVIDRINETIYFIDSLSREDNIKQTKAQLMPLTAKGRLFEGYKIEHPPAGTLRQQQDSFSCGAYTVSNIIGLITQLAQVDVSSHALGIELSMLIKRAQMDLETWTQSKDFAIQPWNALMWMILTSSKPQQLETNFYQQILDNQKTVFSREITKDEELSIMLRH